MNYTIPTKAAFLLFATFILYLPSTAFAQMQTGSTTIKKVPPADCGVDCQEWSYVWQYFDFSEGKTFSDEELGTYTPDIKGSSNEGINFGQEFDSNIPQYRLLLLEGVSFDEEIVVPEWNEGAPWVTTSWEATGYQPIEVGQIWAVYTQESHYALMHITDLPDGVWGTSFTFDYKYLNDGSREFDGTTGEEEENLVYNLDIYSGNGQSAEISSFVPETLKVRLTDENAQPISGASVAFAFTSHPEGANNYGWLNELSITDSDGIAYSSAKLGDKLGEYVVTATLQDDTTKKVSFTLTATEPIEYKFFVMDGFDQQIGTDEQSEPLRVLVTDQNNTPLSGEIVVFSFHYSPQDVSGMSLAPEQAVTDGDGIAQTVLTTGNKAGEYIVKATLSSNTEKVLYFNVYAESDTPAYMFTMDSPDNQLVNVNTKVSGNILIRLLDEFHAPVNGANVNFEFINVPEGATGYGEIPISMVTGMEGYAYIRPKVGDKPGEYVIRASMADNAEVYIDITLIADNITLTLIAGNNQMGLPGTKLPQPLQVGITRSNGEYISGKSINFEESQIPEGAESGQFSTLDGITTNQVYIFGETASINYQIGSKPGEYIIKAYDVNSEFEPVYFNIISYGVNDPAEFTATAGAGFVMLNWTKADGAASYNIYRSSGGNNQESAHLITNTQGLSYSDIDVTPGQEYYYWIKSVDMLGNIGTNNSAPVNATPGEIAEPEYGTGMIIVTGGSQFSKTWQYFDFSAGAASNDAETENFVADIRGTSNEGVNFGNENAPMIDGRRVILLGNGSLEDYSSIPAWTNEAPWIFNSWDFAGGTMGSPTKEGSVWGIYTSEGHYAMMEVTSVPQPHGDTLAFRYKYQPSGSPVFGQEANNPTPDSLLLVSGNNQSSAPGKELGEKLKVRVIDSDKNGVGGVKVFFNFEEVPGDAENYALSADTVLSDFEGYAETSLTLGNMQGTYTVAAQAEGLPNKVLFTLAAEIAPPPTSVELLKIMQFRPNSLVLVWAQSKVANFHHYNIYKSTDNENFELIGSTHTGNSADTSYSAGNLESMTEYYFKVAVVGADEQISDFSNVMSAIPYPKPDKPSQIAVTIGDGAIQLSWEPLNDEHIEYYYVMAGIDGEPIIPRDTVWNLEAPLSLIRNLTNGQVYQFYVIAVNKFGMQSDYSDKISAIPNKTYNERQSAVASLIMGGTVLADIDNDGDNDLFITGIPAVDEAPLAYLYLNDGKGNFTDSGQQFAGVTHPSLYFLDIDFNGFLDLIMIGQGAEAPVTKIYLNQDGKFADSGFNLPLLSYAHLSPADYDNDGDIDLLITGESIVFGLRTILVKNNGGTFEMLDTPLTGLKKASASWADYNGDGNTDLLMAGENSEGEAVSIIYMNNGDDTFSPANVTLQGVLNGEASWLDFNMDGKPDVLLSGYTNTTQSEFYIGLYTNTGSSFELFFSSTTATGSPKTDGQLARSKATIADYDNDGDPDALISAILGGKASASVLKNNGDAIQEEELPLDGHATAIWVDIDGDGDLDIVITGVNDDGSPASKIMDNTTAIKNTPPTVPAEMLAAVAADSVMLSWAASTDAQSPVFALTYNVRIGTAAGKSDILSTNADLSTGKLKAPAAGNAGNKTSMMLRNLANGTYYWQVQAVDNGFMASAFGAEQSFVVSHSSVSNEAQAELPLRFALQQNYPNPFNPVTVISFSLPHADEVVLEVFDVTGRLVATLIHGQVAAGQHSIQFDAHNISSGIYIYRMRTKSGKVMSKKMMLIK